MLLKPSQPMGSEVIQIHGISNEEVMEQPIFPQIAKMISFVLENKHVVCFNASFDVKLLWSLFKKYEQPVPKVAGISCAMEKYSEWKGEWNDSKNGFRWQRLPAMGYGNSHDALTDCLSTLKVLELMAGEYDPTAVSADEISLDF
jgi:DNA polymerase III subunit epsilon